MREVEVKAKVGSLDMVLERLESLGCTLSQPLTQEDFIFVQSDVDFENIALGTTVLRIRIQNGGSYFTLKQSRTNELDCIERVVMINDAQQMIDIIVLMGYKMVAHVKKERVETKVGHYNICLDRVDNIGSFLELEMLVPDDNMRDDIQVDMFSFLKGFGVHHEDRVLVGYDTMIHSLGLGTEAIAVRQSADS